MTQKTLPAIPFSSTRLKAKKYRKEILSSVSSIIDRGVFLNGNKVISLERKLSTMFASSAIAVASGHDALLMALNALDLKSDDEIIFPANAYPTAFPVFLSSGKPVPVDVDINGQLDPFEVEKKITKKTKVIIMVHLYGLAGDIESILKIAKKYNLVLIEDCAQSFGSKFKGKHLGTFGDMGCFSFYPTKNLGALGDGGAIITGNKKYYSYILKARQYGEKARYRSQFIAGHSRLPEIQAEILNLYLKDFKQVMRVKKQLYYIYNKAILNSNLSNNARLLESIESSVPILHLMTLTVRKRSQLKKYLLKNGIETMIHYPYPVNKVKAFGNIKNKNFPNSEYLSKHILSLPFHEYLTDKEVQYIVSKIKNFYEKT